MQAIGAGCAHVGLSTMLSGITSMKLMGAAAAANQSSSIFNSLMSYKAIVCVQLQGGNDSFNMLVPNEDASYDHYANARTNIAIPRQDLLTINPSNTNGERYGLHPSMTRLQGLFESGEAAFIANCGILDRPTSRVDFDNDRFLPTGLFSHPDQQVHWQTSLPRSRDKPGGWGGRLADLLYTNNNSQDISMSISLAGTNIYQRGNQILPYAVKNSDNGSIILNGSQSNSTYEVLKRETLDNILSSSYSNVFKQAYKDIVTGSKENSLAFDAAVSSVNLQTNFPSSSLGKDLKMVSRIIGARNQLDVQNQVFFVSQGGFDNHGDNLETHGGLMSTIDTAFGSFYDSLVELGIENDVVLFTISDFGRKLISNGDGTDHAWGGNNIVLGGPVNGKQIYGQYPSLELGTELDTGGGRFIPTTSADEYFAELSLWFGASSADLDYILPNIRNFWSPSPAEMPIGFLS